MTNLDEPHALAVRCVEVCAERKAEAVRLYDVRRTSLLADYYLICSGGSVPHIRAIVEHLARDLADEGIRPRSVEGTPASHWMVIDFGTVIVHVLHPDLRTYYAIEELWAEADLVREENVES